MVWAVLISLGICCLVMPRLSWCGWVAFLITAGAMVLALGMLNPWVFGALFLIVWAPLRLIEQGRGALQASLAARRMPRRRPRSRAASPNRAVAGGH